MPVARKQLILLGLILLVSLVLLAASDKKAKSKTTDKETPAQAAPMDDDKKIVHALNRFTFGVRPGDVERIGHASIRAAVRVCRSTRRGVPGSGPASATSRPRFRRISARHEADSGRPAGDVRPPAPPGRSTAWCGS